jgi:LacI family transcriptional regulator, galactose operon repressor
MAGPARRVSLAQVASQAGVTASVVSRLLNGDPTLHVRPETRQRILATAKALGYTPNSVARALRLARTGAIALIVPDVTSPIYLDMRRGVEYATKRAGYLALMGNADELEVPEGFYAKLVAERRVDGVLLQRTEYIDDATFWRVVDTDLPTVLVNSRLARWPRSVVLDDEAGAELATRHLIGLGHTRIGLIGGPPVLDWTTRRYRGFSRAMRDAGLHSRWVVTGGHEADTGLAAMQQLLGSTPRPTGVVVANILAAVGALTAARRGGLTVPAEMSVIALHDNWLAEHTEPPLTTVKLPLYQLGARAVELLLDCIGSGRSHQEIVYDPPPQLVVRASTSTLGAGPSPGPG